MNKVICKTSEPPTANEIIYLTNIISELSTAIEQGKPYDHLILRPLDNLIPEWQLLLWTETVWHGTHATVTYSTDTPGQYVEYTLKHTSDHPDDWLVAGCQVLEIDDTSYLSTVL
jgi:hypothetical protein